MDKPDKQIGSGLNVANLQEHLDSAANAADHGMSQFLTPRSFGQLCAVPLPEFRETIVDLNCGAGALLYAAANKSTTNLLGSDIDSIRAAKEEGDKLNIERLHGDITLIFPLLYDVRWRADLFVLNPPWGLQWHKERLASLSESDLLTVSSAFAKRDPGVPRDCIDSTGATILMALEFMSHKGEAMLIANNSTIHRLFFAIDAPYKQVACHFWGHIVVKGNPMTGIKDSQWDKGGEFKTSVLYFAKGHCDGIQHPYEDPCEIDEFAVRVAKLQRQRFRHGQQIEYISQQRDDVSLIWNEVHAEWGIRTGKRKPEYNIFLHPDGTIGTYLSRFEDRSVRIDKTEVKKLHELNGQRPMQLVLQATHRSELKRAVNGGIWRVHPALPELVNKAIAEYHAVRAPLNPLSPVQSLGYLDEEKWITCREDLYIGTELLEEGAKRLRHYIKSPTQKSWEHAAHTVVLNDEKLGPRTAWQLALDWDNQFARAHTIAGVGKGPDGKELVSKPCEEDGSWSILPDPKMLQPILTGRKKVFSAGKIYEVSTQTVKVERFRTKPSVRWDDEDFLLTGQELSITICDDNGEARCFMESKLRNNREVMLSEDTTIHFTEKELIRNFVIPHVPDVAECQPDRFLEKIGQLAILETMLADAHAGVAA